MSQGRSVRVAIARSGEASNTLREPSSTRDLQAHVIRNNIGGRPEPVSVSLVHFRKMIIVGESICGVDEQQGLTDTEPELRLRRNLTTGNLPARQSISDRAFSVRRRVMFGTPGAQRL